MRKLKLSLDALEVDSFHAVGAGDGRGTVVGHTGTQYYDESCFGTCVGMCTRDGTCGEFTCAASCNCGSQTCTCPPGGGSNMDTCENAGCATWETCPGATICA